VLCFLALKVSWAGLNGRPRRGRKRPAPKPRHRSENRRGRSIPRRWAISRSAAFSQAKADVLEGHSGGRRSSRSKKTRGKVVRQRIPEYFPPSLVKPAGPPTSRQAPGSAPASSSSPTASSSPTQPSGRGGDEPWKVGCSTESASLPRPVIGTDPKGTGPPRRGSSRSTAENLPGGGRILGRPAPSWSVR